MPIEKLQPELDRIVSPDQQIEELGSGYGGATARRKDRCGGKREGTCCSVTSTTTAA